MHPLKSSVSWGSVALFAFAIACGSTEIPREIPFPPPPDPPSVELCVELPTNELPTCSAADPALPLRNAPLELSFSALQFGWQTMNHPVTRSLRVNNHAAASVQLERAVISGAGFSVDSAAFPISLPAGQFADVSVTFIPSRHCCQTGTLTLSTSSSTTALTIRLTGMGVTDEKVLGLDPSSIDFGDMPLGESRTRDIWLWNAGSAGSATLANVGTLGEELRVDSFSAAIPFELTTGTHFSLRAVISPQTPGKKTAQLFFLTQLPGFEATQEIQVRYRGISNMQPATSD